MSFPTGTVVVRETAGTQEAEAVHRCSADSEVKRSEVVFPNIHVVVFMILCG